MSSSTSSPNGLAAQSTPHERVAVVIATRGRPELLARVVRQIADQLGGDDELVVVDDSDVPDSDLDWVTAFGTLLRSRGRGPATARNLGWRHSRCDVIAFTDDDVILDSQWLAGIRAAFEQRAGLVAIEGKTHCPPYDILFEYSVQSNYEGNGLTCNAGYRRWVLEQLDGFDEEFPHPHCEDVDLFTRARAVGEVRFAPEVKVHHPPRAVEPRRFARRAAWVASERRLYRKHPALNPYPLPAGVAAVVAYARWPLSALWRPRIRDATRDRTIRRRMLTLTVFWWWNLALALPSMLRD